MQDLRAVGATWLFQWHAKRLKVQALLVKGSYDGVLLDHSGGLLAQTMEQSGIPGCSVGKQRCQQSKATKVVVEGRRGTKAIAPYSNLGLGIGKSRLEVLAKSQFSKMLQNLQVYELSGLQSRIKINAKSTIWTDRPTTLPPCPPLD